MASPKSYKFKIGHSISGWTVKDYLAASDFTDIYIAEKKQKTAALKIYKAQKKYEDLYHEFNIYKQIKKILNDSPTPFEFSSEMDTILWIATEYLNKDNLQKYVKINGPLKEEKWFEFAKKLFTILEILHRNNIVHRDIKPSNILFDNKSISLIDYDLSLSEKNDLFEVDTQQFGGTPSFSSPEHRSGEISSKMDVFSAASTLVFAGTGKNPFPGSNNREIIKKISGSPPNYYKLTLNQINFLKPLFEKNKSDRKNSFDVVNYLNHDSKINWQTFSQVNNSAFENNIWDLASTIPDPNEKLFPNYKRSKFINLTKVFANSLLFILSYFLFIYPQIQLVSISAPISLEQKNKIEIERQILLCLGGAYDLTRLDTDERIFRNRYFCENIDSIDYPEKYIAIAQTYRIINSKIEQESNLIKAALADKNKDYNQVGIMSLANFYAQDNNFQDYGIKKLVPCQLSNLQICAKVLGIYYEKIGNRENELKYKKIAAEKGDLQSAIDVDRDLIRQGKIPLFKDLIYKRAKENNLIAKIATISIYGDKLFINEIYSENNPVALTLKALKEIINQNYENAVTPIFDCLEKYPLEYSCKDVLYILIEFRSDKKDFEELINREQVLSALLGSSTARLKFAQKILQDGDILRANEWFTLVAEENTENSVDAYIQLAKIQMLNNNQFQICSSIVKSNKLLSQIISNKNKSSSNAFLEIAVGFTLPETEINNLRLMKQKEIQDLKAEYCET